MRASFTISFAFALTAAFACGSTTTTDTTHASDAGTGDDGASAGDGGSTTPGAVCKVDGDCNADPTMSSLAGTCDQGRCRCRAGLSVVPGGRCAAKGAGVSCTQKSDCHDGLDCLEFTVHPSPGACNVVGKQCAIACSGSGSACVAALGPGVLCLAGCSGPDGICGLTP